MSMHSEINPHPSYLRVWLTFMRNSLVRDMTFRSNFIIQCLSSASWTLMNFGFYLLVYSYTDSIGKGSGWGRYEFFVFLATTWFITSLVQTFFMPNAQEFSEMIRTGKLDFALLKPIDTQFLISLNRVDWSALTNFFLGSFLLVYSVAVMMTREVDPLEMNAAMVLLYPVYLLCGVMIFYSLMIALSATSIWLGRNQSLYNFWFYITNFSRYPMEIYDGPLGAPLRYIFTFLIPILVVVNVPARLLARPLDPREWYFWPLAAFALFATAGSLLASRWVFKRALLSYRSASS